MKQISIIIGLVGVSVLLILGLSAIGGGNSVASRHSAQIGSALATDLDPIPAPDFHLQKLGGGTIRLAEYKNKKPVVLDFWASWCPNCRRDMPKLNRFYERYKDQIEVIGINLQESESTVRKFAEDRNLTFPIIMDPSGNVSNSFGIRYTNTHILITKEGNIIKVIPGDIRESDIKSLL